MAAVTHRNSTASTANASSYASGSFTPAAGELLFAFVTTSATIAGGTMSDSQGLGFSLVCRALKATSLDTIYFFVANKLAAASSMTVTFECIGDAATSALIQVGGISSMTRLGYDAVKQFKVTSNGAAAGTPAATFDASALTGNPTLGVVGNASNPAAMTPPTNWTELNDTGIDTPNTGAEYVHRDSGFTGTTITWGGTSATAFGVIIAEMDTSAVGPEPQFKSIGTMATGTGTAATSNMPPDWDAGDILFLSLGLSLTTPTTSTPSGWTLVPGGSEGNPVDGATDVRHYLWYRVAVGGDTGPSLTLSISDDWETLIFAYSPVDGTTPINASAGDDFGDGTATSFTTVTITPDVDDTRIVTVVFTDKTTTPAIPLYSFAGSNERAKLEGNSALMFGLSDKKGPAASVAVSQSFIISSTDMPAAFIIALAPDTGAAPIEGELAVTIADFTLAATGVLPIVGTAAPTIAAVTLSGTGVLPIAGVLSQPIGDVTLVAAGGVPALVGELAQTIADFTLSATGVLPIVGAASPTIAPVTLSATGTLPIVGSAAVTLGDVTLAATGTLPIVGTLSQTIAPITLASTGTLPIVGVLSKTLDPVTLVASGTAAEAPNEGQLSATLDAVTLSATGVLSVAGALSRTLDAVTLSATGTMSIVGTASPTVGDVTLAATGALSIVGSASVTLDAVSLSAAGLLPIVGTLSQTLGAVTLVGVGVEALPNVIGSVEVSIFPVGQAEGGMITVGKAKGSVVKTGDIGVEVIEG